MRYLLSAELLAVSGLTVLNHRPPLWLAITGIVVAALLALTAAIDVRRGTR
jgi:hypothetical protein